MSRAKAGAGLAIGALGAVAIGWFTSRHTDAALMSRSSHLYAMVSSDDPFQYLGGLAAAAKVAGKSGDISLHVSQLQDAAEQHTETAARAIALAEANFKGGEFLVGNRYSLADLIVGVALQYVDFRYPHDWRSAAPKLRAWHAGIAARPAFVTSRKSS